MSQGRASLKEFLWPGCNRVAQRLCARPARRAFATTASARSNSDDGPIRPPMAPKPVLNTRHIKENVETYSKNCIDRNYGALAGNPAEIKRLLEESTSLQQTLNAPRAKTKQVEKTIAQLMRASKEETESSAQANELEALRQEAQRLKKDSQDMMAQREKNMEEIQRLALSLPNLTAPETPIGDDPRLVQYINFDPQNPPSYVHSRPEEGHLTSHVDIGSSLGLLDFSSSATSTGWGFYFLVNEGALLEHALTQYALSVALKHGWKAVAPPSLVYSHIAAACGFQPRDNHGEQQIWAIEQHGKDKAKPQRSLAGTAEILLAAMFANREIEASKLPLKFVGSSRCYRAEAGARGVDTKGLYRVHEFTKVEMFGWSDVSADTSKKQPSTELFEELLDIQVEILSSLNLPSRVLEMPSTDLGASAARKRDIEVLYPSRIRPQQATTTTTTPAVEELIESGWGEVTSASICTDYQSRRLGTRIAGRSGQKGDIATGIDVRFPHTINGTAMAVPRVIAALLENCYDDARGVVVLPEVLRPFMGGRETIGTKSD